MRSASSLTLLAAIAAFILVSAAAVLLRTEPVPVREPAAMSQAADAAAAAQTAAAQAAAAQSGRAASWPPKLAPSAPLATGEAARPQAAPRSADAAPAPDQGRACAVHGRVLDPQGLGVPALTVQLYRGREQSEAQTDAEGRFAFSGLQRGLYRLYLDSASLPAGMRLLPPWKQQLAQRYDGQATGLLGTAFRLTDGADPEVNLRVFPAGTVRGRLIDAHGLPIADAAIGIQTADGLHDAARTDRTGAFVFDEAYPGAYATSVDLSRTLAGEASAPLPQHFELAAGGTVVLDDLVAGIGGHQLRGAVVDLAGQPIVGLGVLVQEEADVLYRLRWSVVTDAQGRFEIGRVPSAALVLCLGAGDRDLPRAARLLAENLAPIRIDTRGAPETLDLGVITSEARHPFHVQGRVQIDTAWAERLGLALTPRLELRERGLAARPLELAPLGDDPTSTALTRFTWSCATPHAEVQFRAVLTTPDGAEHERLATLTPTADATQDLLLTFP